MQLKNSLRGTQNYATSIFILYELDTIEKLTSGDAKVSNFYLHYIWA
jgi:hypothetical protein